MRECGLKSTYEEILEIAKFVTPLAGVWIEIGTYRIFNFRINVTPLAGVWIEIC